MGDRIFPTNRVYLAMQLSYMDKNESLTVAAVRNEKPLANKQS